MPEPQFPLNTWLDHAGRPWDARLARRLVMPLRNTQVTPNHLTTLRLLSGLAAALAFLPGTYRWNNAAALLLVLSNFLDHTDGELARLRGNGTKWGHYYDLGCDALITVLLFAAIGYGVGTQAEPLLPVSPLLLGWLAGIATALIFFLRMRIEERAGKQATRQQRAMGFESEDVLYLLPLVTLFNGTAMFLCAAAFGAPLFALWVILDYRRIFRQPLGSGTTSGAV
ncbi:MAG: CDP-alcohol phosphatidyltransferase family protein [Sinobacteraceae bacterium]|nr:CDP-alcohol phosphatidyltransferase family protein [Nevskiaceae bacterium]